MTFSVPDMSCGHCTAAIEAAIKSRDASAQVECDLGARTVAVETGLAKADIAAALADAGYAATPL